MQIISLLAIVLCLFGLLVSVLARPNPCDCFKNEQEAELEPEFEILGDRKDFIKEHRHDILIYKGHLRGLERRLRKDLTDVGVFTDMQYYMDLLATEEGIIECIKKKIEHDEPIDWDGLNNYVPDLKYLKLLWRYKRAINSKAISYVVKIELMREIKLLIDERNKFRENLRSCNLLELYYHRRTESKKSGMSRHRKRNWVHAERKHPF